MIANKTVRKKVIVLYGPPGVGKLTVGKVLAKKTGFPLFHAHLLADLVSSIFPAGTKEFADTFASLWLWLFKKALAARTREIIATLVYGVQTLEGKNDDKFFAAIARIAKECRADIFFIKLKCSKAELHRRIRSVSRRQFNKITNPAILESLRKKYRVDRAIPSVKSLEVDTTKMSPEQTANWIKNDLK